LGDFFWFGGSPSAGTFPPLSRGSRRGCPSFFPPPWGPHKEGVPAGFFLFSIRLGHFSFFSTPVPTFDVFPYFVFDLFFFSGKPPLFSPTGCLFPWESPFFFRKGGTLGGPAPPLVYRGRTLFCSANHPPPPRPKTWWGRGFSGPGNTRFPFPQPIHTLCLFCSHVFNIKSVFSPCFSGILFLDCSPTIPFKTGFPVF